MTKKYELTDETSTTFGHTLYRIRALVDIPGRIKAGELGGWIEAERNLSHDGKCWIGDNARVYGNAKVYKDAWVYENAWVYGNAWLYGKAELYGNAEAYGNAELYGEAKVYGSARVYDDASVYDDAEVYDYAKVYGTADVYGTAKVYEYAKVYDDTEVYDCAKVHGDAIVHETAEVYGNSDICGGVTNCDVCNVQTSVKVCGGVTTCDVHDVQKEVYIADSKDLPYAGNTEDSETRLVFKRLLYTENSHPAQFSLDMTWYVNNGWEVAHIESNMVVYKKTVSIEEYEEYYESLAVKIDRWNNNVD